MTRTQDDFLPSVGQRADGATLACGYLVIITVVPSHFVFVSIAVTPADVYAVAVGLLIVCAHLTNTLGVAKGRNVVRSAVVFFVVSITFNYGYASRGSLTPNELKNMDHKLILLAAALSITLLMCDGVRGRARLDTVLKTVVVTCAFVAAVATLQSRFAVDYTSLFTHIPGLVLTPDFLDFVGERGGFARPAGTTGTPIELGVLCATVLPLAAHYAFLSSAQRSRPWLWWGCTALIFATIYFSLSRSAILGLATAGGLMLIGMSRRTRRTALLLVICAMIALKVLVPGMFGAILRLFTDASTDSSVLYRTHDYPLIAKLFAEHPWVGRGTATWYAPLHEIFDNQYLLTLVEGGIIGLLAFIFLLFSGIYAAVRARYLSTDPQVRELGLALTASLTVPAVGAVTFDLMSFSIVTGLTFLLLGAGGALLRTAQESAAHQRGLSPTAVVVS